MGEDRTAIGNRRPCAGKGKPHWSEGKQTRRQGDRAPFGLLVSLSPAVIPAEVRHPPLAHVLFPLVQQRPADGAGAEVGHVLILRQPVDGLLQDAVVAAEDRAVAGQQELGVVLADALQRLEEVGDVGAVVGVDDADAAVLVDVVAAEKQVAHLEAELARRCGPACARPSASGRRP